MKSLLSKAQDLIDDLKLFGLVLNDLMPPLPPTIYSELYPPKRAYAPSPILNETIGFLMI